MMSLEIEEFWKVKWHLYLKLSMIEHTSSLSAWETKIGGSCI